MPRPATPTDIPELHALVLELAEFENLSHQVESSPDNLHAALFGDPVRMEALVEDDPAQPGRLAGSALFFPTFSTFAGKPGLWLEDLYVRPDHRGRGVGGALIREFLETARSRGCARAEWNVLDWNKDAIEFYENLGASILPDWRTARISCSSAIRETP